MQRPEITIAVISSSHTSLYCPAAAQSTWSPWRQRCVLWASVSQGRWFLQQCSEHCGDKVPTVPCPYSCEWGWACGTWAASYLCLWLCYAASLSTAATPALILLWLYAPERPRRALHQSLPRPPASRWWARAQLTAQELQQPNAESWFLQPMAAASGCPCASSTAGDNAAPWMTLAVWKLGVEAKQTKAHIVKDGARN